MAPPLSYSFFADRLQQRFRVTAHAGVELQLLEADQVAASLPGHQAFTLLFSGPLPALPQDIYTLDAPAHGELDLFLVPVAREGDAIHYQAIFN